MYLLFSVMHTGNYYNVIINIQIVKKNHTVKILRKIKKLSLEISDATVTTPCYKQEVNECRYSMRSAILHIPFIFLMSKSMTHVKFLHI